MTTEPIFKMTKDLKARWLARLRDPNSKQGKEKLCGRTGGYCCLGLLCEELGLLTDTRPDGSKLAYYKESASGSLLPYPLSLELGLSVDGRPGSVALPIIPQE